MTERPPNPKGTERIARDRPWRAELSHLRELMRQSDLTEVLKWGQPCYTTHGGNDVFINGFKHDCAVNFVKGALLKDPEGILIQQTENVQATRQLRFTSLDEIKELEPTLKKYVREAIAIEKADCKSR